MAMMMPVMTDEDIPEVKDLLKQQQVLRHKIMKAKAAQAQATRSRIMAEAEPVAKTKPDNGDADDEGLQEPPRTRQRTDNADMEVEIAGQTISAEQADVATSCTENPQRAAEAATQAQQAARQAAAVVAILTRRIDAAPTSALGSFAPAIIDDPQWAALYEGRPPGSDRRNPREHEGNGDSKQLG